MISIDSERDYIAFVGDTETISYDLVEMLIKYTQLVKADEDINEMAALASVLLTATTSILSDETGVSGTICDAILMAADSLVSSMEFDGMNPPENVYQSNSPVSGQDVKSILKRVSNGDFPGNKKHSKKN